MKWPRLAGLYLLLKASVARLGLADRGSGGGDGTQIGELNVSGHDATKEETKRNNDDGAQGIRLCAVVTDE